jgi:hypothetical protein
MPLSIFAQKLDNLPKKAVPEAVFAADCVRSVIHEMRELRIEPMFGIMRPKKSIQTNIHK